MIFYFTGTGNTKWAAQRMAEVTGEELLFIPDVIRKGIVKVTISEGERLGFCFPTHGWQPPRIVREFIQHTAFSVPPSTYIYALTTCGDNMGELMTIFGKELKNAGLWLDASFAVVMPESNVCFSFLHLDTPEKAEQKIAAADVQLEHIADIVKNKERGVSQLVKGAIPRTYSYVIGGYYNRHLIKDDKFWVDKEACIECGLCARVCPVDDITGAPPEWIHNGRCTNCLACYHHCPRHAIHWAKMKRGQYLFNKREDRR